MGSIPTDLFITERAGTAYKISGQDIIAMVNANFGTTERTVADIAARDALTGLSLGDQVYVTVATGDPTVTTGWAIYRYNGSGFTKILEQEGIDAVSASANLAYIAGPSAGNITNSNGTGFAIPLTSGTNAGLESPANKTKLDFLTITSGTNLDTIRIASHAAVTLLGTASTNPITLSGQTLSFSIASLASAP